MDSAELYLTGWRIGFAYLCGMSDGGKRPDNGAFVAFPDAYGAHYRDQTLSPLPNLQEVSIAYKQWLLMQTTAPEPTKEVELTACERD